MASTRAVHGAAGHLPDEAPTVRLLLCERCGRVLPSEQTDDRLLRRLSQMARFGIGAGSGPILSGDRH
jgi:hypothetical protein